jgi:hypothetical protein
MSRKHHHNMPPKKIIDTRASAAQLRKISAGVASSSLLLPS